MSPSARCSATSVTFVRATSGRGQFSMEFSNYAPVSRNILEKVQLEVAERKAAKKKK